MVRPDMFRRTLTGQKGICRLGRFAQDCKPFFADQKSDRLKVLRFGPPCAEIIRDIDDASLRGFLHLPFDNDFVFPSSFQSRERVGLF